MSQIYGLVATDILLIFYAYFLAHQVSNIRSVIKAIMVYLSAFAASALLKYVIILIYIVKNNLPCCVLPFSWPLWSTLTRAIINRGP